MILCEKGNFPGIVHDLTLVELVVDQPLDCRTESGRTGLESDCFAGRLAYRSLAECGSEWPSLRSVDNGEQISCAAGQALRPLPLYGFFEASDADSLLGSSQSSIPSCGRLRDDASTRITSRAPRTTEQSPQFLWISPFY